MAEEVSISTDIPNHPERGVECGGMHSVLCYKRRPVGHRRVVGHGALQSHGCNATGRLGIGGGPLGRTRG